LCFHKAPFLFPRRGNDLKIILSIILITRYFFSLGQFAFGEFAAVTARGGFGAGCGNFFVYNEVACRGGNSAKDEEATSGGEKCFSVHNVLINKAGVSNHRPGFCFVPSPVSP